MFKVNLMPWRDRYRQKQQQQFYLWLAVSLLIGFGLGAAYWFFENQRLENKKDELVKVEAEKKELEKKLAEFVYLQELEMELQRKLDALEQLQKQRFLMADRMNLLPSLMNEGVVLEAIQSDEELMTAEGFGVNEFSVSSLMRKLDGSDLFSGSSVNVITEIQKDRIFTLPGQEPEVDMLRFNIKVQNEFGNDTTIEVGTPNG